MEMELGLDPLHHLGIGEVAVPTKDDERLGPGVA